MKSTFVRLAVRGRDRAAFTLIELLAVMAIILVLAGLIISIAGSAQYNSAKSRATGELRAMETALESYKSDNGAYPSDSSNANSGSTPTCEKLDAQKIFDPGQYLNSSEFLYQALAGFQITAAQGNTSAAVASSKVYMQFRPDQLHIASNATGTTTVASSTSPYMYIIDPFGFSYGYSTIYAVTLAANNASTPPNTSAITVGYNPTFDLWSSAGYAPGAKTTPANLTGTDAANYSSLWIKNW